MAQKIDLTGQRFGRLLVLKENGRTNDGKVKWLCICDCGKYTSPNGKHLRAGRSTSCGCFSRDRAITHGLSGTKSYKHWTGMIVRCSNSNGLRWKDYGGRGITVCARWLDFSNFYADMGDAPLGKSLDRRDNSLGYSPDNCRWATPKEQARNRRDNHFVTYKDRTLTITEWEEETGIPSSAILNRLKKGWNVEDVLATPLRPKEYLITWRGETRNLNQWAKYLNIGQDTLWHRINISKWSIDKAFTTKP